ncbi:SelB translation factor [Achromobacter spanius]|uniref:selenocysteine-specific translation elongation factor n=1 Tax=Achromobacter spanius TaxID=217203 RepID=UPI000C2BF6B1|nr:selenocysteine-specific translation elongation factor [Achromobacter spanius]AUA55319.1 selenocysteine-specific translation elongation factor [Achromobacter spanius]CAB3678757.1 Selenocysteine-specific elongation factor [Achromobacter spanius]SPT38156.1 SelB translation factor [Achromobacter denitrificans]VEE57218.1 SelB translation factor [Achromobacter spanius]
MIIGTAGHIDHGKTTLVRALTGVDTDRLKEEKARGISIELGYAYTPLANGDVLGFIDVPGHEKLVHTMAAGASGIDFGLLVVAADDGVMPQTREHLAILTLLGVAQGAVALTKADRADAARLAAVRAEIAALTAGTFLDGTPVYAVCAAQADDAGTADLKHYLHAQAEHLQRRGSDGLFRLAVDRVFTLAGHGTVVTGTAHSGQARAGDDSADLRVMPAGTRVRVRSIHAQNQPSDTGTAGQRCALNLAGIDKQAISRGDWIADARCFLPSRHVDVALTLLPSADAPLRAWAPLHVHIGAARQVAHVVPLSAETLAPGQSGWVQLVFDEPVCAMPGDRFIVRNAQATRTVGGGRVLDPNAPDRKRRAAARMQGLQALCDMLDGGGLPPVLAHAPLGLDEGALQRLTGKPVQDIEAPHGALWIESRHAQGPRTLIGSAHWDALRGRVEQALASFHQSAPDEPGPDSARLRRMAMPVGSDALWTAVLDHLQRDGRVARNGPWLHLPSHTATLAGEESALAQRLLPLLDAGAFDPPWVRDLARMQGEPEERVRQLMRKLLRRGEVAQVVKDLFYHRDQVRVLARLAAELAAQPPGLNAAVFRDRTGLGRKRAIQILEFFDRVGYTRRVRDTHLLRGESAYAGMQNPMQDSRQEST